MSIRGRRKRSQTYGGASIPPFRRQSFSINNGKDNNNNNNNNKRRSNENSPRGGEVMIQCKTVFVKGGNMNTLTGRYPLSLVNGQTGQKFEMEINGKATRDQWIIGLRNWSKGSNEQESNKKKGSYRLKQAFRINK